MEVIVGALVITDDAVLLTVGLLCLHADINIMQIPISMICDRRILI